MAKKKKSKRQKANRAAERELRDEYRAGKIWEFGTQRTAKLIAEKSGLSLMPTDREAIQRLMVAPQESVSKEEIKLLYRLLRSFGMLLRYNSDNIVAVAKYTSRNTKAREQLIYTIREKGSDACKIGVSMNPTHRLSELQVGNPRELYISMLFEPRKGPRQLEQLIHKQFGRAKLRGEWFAGVTDDQIRSIMRGHAAEVSTLWNSVMTQPKQKKAPQRGLAINQKSEALPKIL